MIDDDIPMPRAFRKNAVIAIRKQRKSLLSGWSARFGRSSPATTGSILQTKRSRARHSPGENVFLALGRQHIAPFAKRADVHFVIRMIDPPEVTLPRHCEIILARPGDYDAEADFLTGRRIGLIVSRNSGGTVSYAKIGAARDLALPVMMIARPPVAAKNRGCDSAASHRLCPLCFKLLSARAWLCAS